MGEHAAEERSQEFRELAADAVELLIHVGLMNSVAAQWPEEVQRNWTQKMGIMREWIKDQVVEVQQFTEAYDDPGDD